MAYKSILSVVTDNGSTLKHLDWAVEFARKNDAHLDVLCLGIDRTDVALYAVGASVAIAWQGIEDARKDAVDFSDAVKARLQAEDIRWSTEGVVTQIGLIGSTIGSRARFADLVILGRPEAGSSHDTSEAVLEGALFDGRAPVLLVPPTQAPSTFGSRIVLAWNQSEEAMAAARLALPFLKQAKAVDIAVVDPSSSSDERSDPGGALSQMLARHGVKTEVSVLARTQPKIADILQRHAVDYNADMIVMGGFGHSRFREAILGGATRHMLETAQVPVFMAR